MAIGEILSTAGGLANLYAVAKRQKDKILMARVKRLYRRMNKIDKKLSKGKMEQSDFDKEMQMIRDAIEDAYEDIEKIRL